MVERCGDRQRKFNGLEKWPFRIFIESLPVMLQIALLLLACGLSRYIWSVNTSVAPIVISFTVLGVLFYFGIVAAGTSSYECPFQTPASTVLRYLRVNGTTKRWFAGFPLSNAIPLAYAAWMNAQQGVVSAFHRARDITRHPLSWEFSLSHIMSSIRSAVTKVGHQGIIILLRVDRALGDAKYRWVRGFRRFMSPRLLPIAVEDTTREPPAPGSGPWLRVRVWNVESVRKQNADNARCVCWVLRNITDPEAIDSAIRLAGAIRWFDGDSDFEPPFDLIVSTFESCFDSTRQLYPGMRDRAYFSARAILQINLSARGRSGKHASKYPILAISPSSFQLVDHDLRHIIDLLDLNSRTDRPALDFPRLGTNTYNHSLWMSNLLVDVTYVGPNPVLKSYRSYLSAAITNHRAVIANILLTWYMFLGGRVEEETFWAVDKSYAVVSLPPIPARLNSCTAVTHWRLSSLTCLRKSRAPSPTEPVPNFLNTSWYF